MVVHADRDEPARRIADTATVARIGATALEFDCGEAGFDLRWTGLPVGQAHVRQARLNVPSFVVARVKA